jgi:hypothetical protein
MCLALQPETDIRESELDLVLRLRLVRQITKRVQDTKKPKAENLQVGWEMTQRIEAPEVGHLQVGGEAMQGAKAPQVGHLQVGRQAMLDNRIAMTSHLQVGRKSSRRARGSRTRNQDEPSQDNMLAEVLKGLAGQMADMTHNRSYSGVGHGVKETYDVHVPASHKKKLYLEKLPASWNVMPRTNTKDSEEIIVINSIFKNKFNGLDDGSYLMWGPEVRNTIQTANILVQRKHMFITKFLNRKEVRLAAMCSFTTFTTSTYVDLIEELELMYGGLNRCFDFVRTKLINGSKLKLNDMTNMHDVRGRIENFIKHCHMHGLSKDINNKLMLQLVHCKVITPSTFTIVPRE